MTENQSAVSVLTVGERSIRRFGRTLQLVAAGEVQSATSTNWAETCSSLQGKIQALVREMELLKEQNETLSLQNMVLCSHNNQKADEIFYLKDEILYLREELELCSHNLTSLYGTDPFQQPSTSNTKNKDPPMPITRIIDEINLLSEDELN